MRPRAVGRALRRDAVRLMWRRPPEGATAEAENVMESAIVDRARAAMEEDTGYDNGTAKISLGSLVELVKLANHRLARICMGN